MRPSTHYDYDDLQRLRRGSVYAWRRGDAWLYVGTTGAGVGRFLSRHHVIGVRESLKPGDRIDVWFVGDARSRGRLEDQLIREHAPRYNQPVGYRPPRARLRQRRCHWPRCNAPFRPRRKNQIYHTDQCRNAHWREEHPRSQVHLDGAEETT